MEASVITHKKKNIVLIDFSGLRLNENKRQALALVDRAENIISKYLPSTALLLTNLTDAEFDIELVSRMKTFTSHNTPYTKKSAVVGVQGIQKTVLRAVSFFARREITQFSKMEDARDWLVGD